MKKSLIICLMAAALVCVFALPAVFASAAPDNVTMTAPEGAKMTKAPVEFPHKMHVDTGIDCLVCHHKAANADAAQSCSAEGCHTDASKGAKKDPKGFYSAFHSKKSKTSCLGCHKAEKKAGKAAPTSCKDCHPKK